MKKPDGPCPKDCPNRSETCHVDCENYIEYKKELERYKTAVHEEKAAYYIAFRKRKHQKRGKNVQKEWDARWDE